MYKPGKDMVELAELNNAFQQINSYINQAENIKIF